jgi:hypothetical protein
MQIPTTGGAAMTAHDGPAAQTRSADAIRKVTERGDG